MRYISSHSIPSTPQNLSERLEREIASIPRLLVTHIQPFSDLLPGNTFEQSSCKSESRSFLLFINSLFISSVPFFSTFPKPDLISAFGTTANLTFPREEVIRNREISPDQEASKPRTGSEGIPSQTERLKETKNGPSRSLSIAFGYEPGSWVDEILSCNLETDW